MTKTDQDVLNLIAETAVPFVPTESDMAEHTTKPKKPNDGTRAVVVPFSEIVEKEYDWLWQNRFPLGELNLFFGYKAQGKSFMAYYLAAKVSRGGLWFDGTPCPHGSVLFFAGEDSPSKTSRKRLRANDANLASFCKFNNNF